jgi:hypothetical protein
MIGGVGREKACAQAFGTHKCSGGGGGIKNSRQKRAVEYSLQKLVERKK